MTDHLPECPSCRTVMTAQRDEARALRDAMTDHLPECFERELIGLDCICDRLRACEARVQARTMDVVGPHNYKQGVKDGFAAGVQAAREAVAGATVRGQHRAWVFKDDALAAIDALRGSGNPDTPPSAEKGAKR